MIAIDKSTYQPIILTERPDGKFIDLMGDVYKLDRDTNYAERINER